MLEYVFFNRPACDAFVARLDQGQVAFDGPQQSASPGDADSELWSVLVPEDLADELSDELDEFYDALMAGQAQEVIEQDTDSINLVGVQYTRDDGQLGVVRLQPDRVNQLTQCLSLEELQVLVQEIADEVQAEHTGSLCRVLSGRPDEA